MKDVREKMSHSKTRIVPFEIVKKKIVYTSFDRTFERKTLRLKCELPCGTARTIQSPDKSKKSKNFGFYLPT